MDSLYKRRGLCAGFTLIEVVSVVAVIFILAGVITIRLGDLRSAALTTSARALEKEFAKAVENLISHGADLRPLQTIAARGSVVSQRTSDPEFMSLQSTNYRLSDPAEMNIPQVADILSQLNSMLLAGGIGAVKGEINQEMLRVFKTDLVVVRDSGNSIRGTYLKFYKP
jgi:type II secretory pathway pseudopilin PulG